MPPQYVPTEPLRRIDWLAVAPWLLLFRVPGVALSWRVLVPSALLGYLAGFVPASPVALAPAAIARAAFEGIAWPWGWLMSCGEFFDLPRMNQLAAAGEIVGTTVFAAWAFVAVSRIAASRLTNQRAGVPLWTAVALPFRSLVVLPASCLLIAIPLTTLFAVGWFSAWLGLSAIWPMSSLLILFATLATAVAATATPLAAVAIGVEDVDAFDAVSRGVAYATQRLGRLAFYVTTAVGIGCTAGLLLESLIALHGTFLEAIVTRPTEAIIPLTVWDDALRVFLRGYYVAYWIIATTAIYLLLRRDIDGQPLDEMAFSADQASSADA